MSVSSAAAPRLVMRGIVKRYPTTVANDGVDLTVRVGEIHALIGYDLQQAVEGGLQTAVHVARRDEFGQKGRDLPVEVFTMENIKTLERRRKLWEKGERAGPNIGLGL